jgi:hypothetical protein
VTGRGGGRQTAGTDEVVLRKGMPEEEIQLRLKAAQWVHGGRDGARRRLDFDVIDGLMSEEEADKALAALDRQAAEARARLSALEKAVPSMRGRGLRGARSDRGRCR